MPLTDERFLADLEIGYGFQRIVADRLRDDGLTVELPPLRVRPGQDDWRRYSDSYDLMVEGLPVEVKTTTRAFTSTEDWPGEFHGVAIVDNARSWDAKLPRPVAVVIISQETQATLVVPVSTRPQWLCVQRKNKRYGGDRGAYYTVDIGLLKSLDEFVNWIKEGRVEAA